MMRKTAPTPDGTETPIDSGLRDFVGYNLRRTSNAVMSDAARVLEPLGLRVTTFSALTVICDTQDVTQSQLAAALNMERSNTVLIIDALEQAGMIGRHRMESDRRSFALRPTLVGIKARKDAVRALAKHEDRMFARLSAEERAQLIALLQRVEIPD